MSALCRKRTSTLKVIGSIERPTELWKLDFPNLYGEASSKVWV
jgi:hypothetical protein